MTADNSLLSTEETTALRDELAQAGAASAFDDGQVRPFALGSEALRPVTRLAGLERMGERLAQRVRAVIEPFARSKVQVSADPIETLRFEEWRTALPGFTSLSLYRLRPLKGGLLVVVEPDFVVSLVDAFYGGSGISAKSKTREFTPTEDRLLGRLTDGLIDKLVEIWSEVGVLSPSFVSRETNPDYASLVRGDEAVVVQRFTVVPGQGRATTIAFVYPLAALRPYQAQLSAKVHDDAGPADSDWSERLAYALEAVNMPVRSVLARPELSVAQLMELKVGDVIPITLAQKVPLIVANKRLAYGTIGEQEGRAALKIEHVERGTGR